jgi:hypothetical protein
MLTNPEHCASLKETFEHFKAADTIEKQYSLLSEFLMSDFCKKELIFLRRHLMKVCTHFSVNYQAAQNQKEIASHTHQMQ